MEAAHIQVSTVMTPLVEGNVQLDVVVAGVPSDLFGASFHMVLEGVEWDLQSYEVGEVFSGAEPLVLLKQKDNVLVTGVTLKRTDEAAPQDGTIIRYVLTPYGEGTLRAFFTNGVLSAFSGDRQDLLDVQWQGSELVVAENVALFDSAEVVPLEGLDSDAEFADGAEALADDFEVLTAEGPVYKDELFVEAYQENDLTLLYVFLVAILVIALVIAGGWYWLWMRRQQITNDRKLDGEIDTVVRLLDEDKL